MFCWKGISARMLLFGPVDIFRSQLYVFFPLVHCLCLHYRLADVRYMLSACDLLLTLLSYVNSEFFPQTLLGLKLHTSIVVVVE